MGRGRTRDNGRWRPVVVMAAIMLLASVPADMAAVRHGPESRSLPLALHPGSMQPSGPRAQGNVALAVASSPTYDEQVGMTMTQNAASLTYNVTAVAQSDADGYGPAYILNGLTGLGYWYQVGISWHWPNTNGGYNPTFGFSYQVFGPDGKPAYPTNGGAGLGSFSKAVNSGDLVLLSLTFSGTNVRMFAQDWATGATAQASFSNEGASAFVGNQARYLNAMGFFTGLMTEWYHSAPYYGNEGKVTYSDQSHALSSAWMWVDEFKSGNSGAPLFANGTQSPVEFANAQELYQFSSNGMTLYAGAHVFITGALGAATSHITLTPSAAEQASPSFTATYTLAGLPQSAQLTSGTTQIEADSGTELTISGNASATDGSERWVFSASGAALVVSAGSNATFVYYHLATEAVSYAAEGGSAPASSDVTLIYQAPPASPSSTAALVTMRQQLGTTPVNVSVVLGSEAQVNGTIPGAPGERWSAGGQRWSVSAPNVIPDPIQLYHQYQTSIRYSVVGGGTPTQSPQFTSTSLGASVTVPLSIRAATTGWFDAGEAYSFSNILNGSASGERWLGSASDSSAISSPNEALAATYTHQYYADLGVNDPRAGSISQASGWLDAGRTLNATATTNPQWQFDMWNGTGQSEYPATDPSLVVDMTGPIHEVAVFYARLAVAAATGTNVVLSYGSNNYTVQAGTTKDIYVPPAAYVTLRAVPSSLIYSFASWQGAGLDNSSASMVSLTVGSPASVLAKSTYNYPLISIVAAAAVGLIALGALAIRNGRRDAAPSTA